MKAKNNKELTRAYVQFSVGIAMAILIGSVGMLCFIRTAQADLRAIDRRARTEEDIYSRQFALMGAADSIYNNLMLLNSNPYINDQLLQKRISTQLNYYNGQMDGIDPRDMIVYRKFAQSIKPLQQLKESIRLMTLQEADLKKELLKSMENNKKISSRLSMSGPDTKQPTP